MADPTPSNVQDAISIICTCLGEGITREQFPVFLTHVAQVAMAVLEDGCDSFQGSTHKVVADPQCRARIHALARTEPDEFGNSDSDRDSLMRRLSVLLNPNSSKVGVRCEAPTTPPIPVMIDGFECML